MNILKAIWNWFKSLFKRKSSDSPVEEEEEPIIEEVEIEPKVTISTEFPNDGENCDVWMKYYGGE